jgi:ribosomal protein L11 methyltransferase
MAWLTLTLEVGAAEAEVASEALLDAGALATTLDEPDAQCCRLTALLSLGTDVAAMVRATFPHAPPYEVQRVEDEDWVRRSQAQFEPLQIGRRLWVGPTWREPPAGVEAVVRLDPGMAFGTGSHPSTRLVLQFLVEAVQGGERVLDYGCGSGILGIAAAKLGAAQVDGVDVDAEALSTAAANARANAVAMRVALPEEPLHADYEIVVANILAQPLILLAPLLAAKTRIGGRVALSGLLESQAEEVALAYAGHIRCHVSHRLDGWALVEGRR